ncbi:MAG: ABC transporter permease [Thermodesulfobacteriota bacterium]
MNAQTGTLGKLMLGRALVTDLVTIAIRQLFRNRRRYKGAIIGTTIGIAGLVTVLTIGDSVESNLGMNLQVLGTATIVKAVWDIHRSQRWHPGEFTRKDVEDIGKLPGVFTVSATVWSFGEMPSFMRKKSKARVAGIDASFFETMNLSIGKGRRLLDQDVVHARHVCVIGQILEQKLFGEKRDSLGKAILLRGHLFTVIGVLGGAEDPEYLETMIVPISVATAKLNHMREIRNVYIRAVNWDVVPELALRVEQILKRNQGTYAEAVQVQFFKERIQAVKRIVFFFKTFLYAAIVVTILLGALGITNVMLSVVRERTREIGLRLAVGATPGLILAQFLCESLAVGTAGSVLGIAIGFVAVQAISAMIEVVPNYLVFLYSIAGSVVLGIVLGIASGLLPAARASKLDCVTAMRFE